MSANYQALKSMVECWEAQIVKMQREIDSQNGLTGHQMWIDQQLGRIVAIKTCIKDVRVILSKENKQ